MSNVEEFQHAIRSEGLEPPAIIEPGKLHRFPSNGRRGDDAGWCKLFHDLTGGVYGDHRTGLNKVWQAKQDESFSQEEREAFRRQCQVERCEREVQEARRKAAAAKKTAAIWEAAEPATINHPYLARKCVKAHGLRIYRGDLVISGMPCDGALIIPARDTSSVLHTIELVHAEHRDGDNKRFFPGGDYRGRYFSIGNVDGAQALCIAEGYATGATIHEATGWPVALAFNAGNLKPVALALREKFPQLQLILCADDDTATEGNPGLTKAKAAALAVGGKLAVPDFGTGRPVSISDFNDLATLRDAEAVANAINGATFPGQNATSGDSTTDWTDPQPLTAKVEPEPYPLDALPEAVRAPVIEVQRFTKAPMPLVASSALAALSLAIQAHADVRRDEILIGPVGLFLLTIADSGERKTQADKMFLQSIIDYQDEQRNVATADGADYQSKLTAWEAKRSGVVDAIKQASRKGTPTSDLELNLSATDREKPKAKRFAKLIREDATPEGLAKKLQNQWPSAGVISNEAGIVFGAHGMGKDSVMRNLGLLNKLWDGGRYQSDRGDENRDRDVRGARLTMALMIQEPMLRAFFDQSKGLARGSGFMARFLVAWPNSTMGTRFYSDPTKGNPELEAFNRRIAAILNQPVSISDDGALSPTVLALAPDAKDAWVTFHDVIEAELFTGGELYDVRDVASKSADNAARLAALFQVFEHGMCETVTLEAFEGASRIAAWHLNEARRFFGELALPTELTNAARLDSWLLGHCRRNGIQTVCTKTVQQFGPGGLREKSAIESALRELSELSRARLKEDGRRRTIEVNPALLIERGEA